MGDLARRIPSAPCHSCPGPGCLGVQPIHIGRQREVQEEGRGRLGWWAQRGLGQLTLGGMSPASPAPLPQGESHGSCYSPMAHTSSMGPASPIPLTQVGSHSGCHRPMAHASAGQSAMAPVHLGRIRPHAGP